MALALLPRLELLDGLAALGGRACTLELLQLDHLAALLLELELQGLALLLSLLPLYLALLGSLHFGGGPDFPKYFEKSDGLA